MNAIPGFQTTKHPGMLCGFVLAIRFHRWAQSLTVPMTPELIQSEWSVSRATSYRWRTAYQDALCQTSPQFATHSQGEL